MELAPRTKVTKGRLGSLTFQFNPSGFVDNIGVNYNELTSAGISYPILTYGGGQTRTVSFTIYFNDKFGSGVTQKSIAILNNYLPPARKTGFQFVSPKSIIFAFGWFVKDCLLQSMQVEYLAFSPDLRPIEANVSVTLIVIQ